MAALARRSRIDLLSFGTASPGDAFSGGEGKAALLALMVAGLWGSATAFGRRALRSLDVPLSTAAGFSRALLLPFGIAAIRVRWSRPGAPAGDGLRLPLIALGPGLVAMLLQTAAAFHAGAGGDDRRAAFPAMVLVVNYLFLDAMISFAQLVGMAASVTISLLHRAPVRVPEPIEPPLAGPIPAAPRLLRHLDPASRSSRPNDWSEPAQCSCSCGSVWRMNAAELWRR